jgi:hypothetical protein
MCLFIARTEGGLEASVRIAARRGLAWLERPARGVPPWGVGRAARPARRSNAGTRAAHTRTRPRVRTDTLARHTHGSPHGPAGSEVHPRHPHAQVGRAADPAAARRAGRRRGACACVYGCVWHGRVFVWRVFGTRVCACARVEPARAGGLLRRRSQGAVLRGGAGGRTAKVRAPTATQPPCRLSQAPTNQHRALPRYVRVCQQRFTQLRAPARHALCRRAPDRHQPHNQHPKSLRAWIPPVAAGTRRSTARS